MTLGSQKGMSIVEVMIAILIFALGISMAMNTLPQSNVATSRGRNMTKATNLAQEQIERLRSISYGSSELSAGDHTDPRNPIDRHFNRRWTVQNNYPIQGMKRVAVTVSFPTASKDSTATLSTFITSRR